MKKLWRTCFRYGLLFHTCAWQDMHTVVEGMPADGDFSTEEWQ